LIVSAFSFHPEFAGPSDWAGMYRANGMQVVPAPFPMRTAADKRPALSEWKTLHEDLVTDAVFERWYAYGTGQHYKNPNMGVICGHASDNLMVIDADQYKSATSGNWWQDVIKVHNHNIDPDTWRAKTGGGGTHRFFKAPLHWRVPTNRTALEVDIRGQGGFAMLPPSKHLSGNSYEWTQGFEPWTTELAEAPQWLLDAVDELVANHAGASTGGGERTANPGADFDAFGARVDGREQYMTQMVWAACVNLWRDSPIMPHPAELDRLMREAYAVYERGTKTRLQGVDNDAGLEREGRGISLFAAKWRRALSKWESRVAEDGARPSPNQPPPGQAPPGAPPPPGASPGWSAGQFSGTSEPIPVSSIKGIPKPREWLVQDWIPAGAITALYGDGGTGKTLLGQQLIYAGDIGAMWLGIEVPITRGLAVLCEDDEDELHRRHDDIKADLGHAIGNPFTRSWVWPRIGNDNILVTFDRDNRPNVSAFFFLIKKHVLEKQIGLLVLDTVADFFGGNENIKAQVNYFIKVMCADLIVEAHAAGFTLTVVLLAHPSQAGMNSGAGTAGSVGWNAGVRSRLYLTRDPDGGSDDRILARMKSNYAAAGEDKTMDLFWADGVLKPRVQGASAWPDKYTCQQILDAIAEAWNSGHPWSNASQTKKEGRYAARHVSERFPVSPKQADLMIDTWLMNAVLSVEIYDKHAKLKGLRVIGRID
jgi:hypothetical protein